MDKRIELVLLGLLSWIIPFAVSFLFVDATGNMIIDMTFFKTIMVITGALVGVALAVHYFKGIKDRYLEEGIVIGVAWLIINLGLDLVMVSAGFFPMTFMQYFTDIGLRYLSIPIFTIGLGYIVDHHKKKK